MPSCWEGLGRAIEGATTSEECMARLIEGFDEEGIVVLLFMMGNRVHHRVDYWRCDDTGSNRSVSVAVPGPHGRPQAMVILIDRSSTTGPRFWRDRSAISEILQHTTVKCREIELAKSSGPSLTPRERQCMGLIAEGALTKEVAAKIGLTVRGVNFHVSNAVAKLGARNRVHAAILAVRWGQIDL